MHYTCPVCIKGYINNPFKNHFDLLHSRSLEGTDTNQTSFYMLSYVTNPVCYSTNPVCYSKNPVRYSIDEVRYVRNSVGFGRHPVCYCTNPEPIQCSIFKSIILFTIHIQCALCEQYVKGISL